MKAKKHLDVRIPLWWPGLPGNLRAWLPSRGNVLFVVIVLGALMWAQSAGAFPGAAPAAPTATSTGTIAYQGRLADAGGAPLTGTYSMIFRIYNAATGSVPLWTEQWTGSNSVQVSDGLFNVMLGNMTPISQTMITGNSNLWLGIMVGNDDEMLPRVQLGSVPYAVQALTVPDGNITSAKIADGNVTTADVADSAITTAKIADGNVTTADVADNSITTAKIVDGAVGSADIANSFGSTGAPLQNVIIKPAENNIWNGSMDVTSSTFDLTSETSSTASAVILHILVTDVSTQKAWLRLFYPGETNTAKFQVVWPQTPGYNSYLGIIPCDSSQRIGYDVLGEQLDTVIIRVVGWVEPAK
jgi:hypothetical protein